MKNGNTKKISQKERKNLTSRRSRVTRVCPLQTDEEGCSLSPWPLSINKGRTILLLYKVRAGAFIIHNYHNIHDIHRQYGKTRALYTSELFPQNWKTVAHVKLSHYRSWYWPEGD